MKQSKGHNGDLKSVHKKITNRAPMSLIEDSLLSANHLKQFETGAVI